MTNTAKAAPEKAAGKKTLYCKDCKHYDREAVARKEPGCTKLNEYVCRKNFCEDWEA